MIDVQGDIAKGEDEKTRHPGFNMATVFADVPSDKKIEKDDIHAKLMRSYPEVPNWWYLTVFAVFLALMVVAQEVSHDSQSDATARTR